MVDPLLVQTAGMCPVIGPILFFIFVHGSEYVWVSLNQDYFHYICRHQARHTAQVSPGLPEEETCIEIFHPGAPFLFVRYHFKFSGFTHPAS